MSSVRLAAPLARPELEVRLREQAARLDGVSNELGRLCTQLRQAVLQIFTVQQALDAHLASARWRVGSRLVGGLELLVWRRKTSLPVDDVVNGLGALARVLAASRSQAQSCANWPAEEGAKQPPRSLREMETLRQTQAGELDRAREELAEQCRQVQIAARQLADIRQHFDLHLASTRWRAGNCLIRCVELLLGRRKVLLASDEVEQGLRGLASLLATAAASTELPEPQHGTSPAAPSTSHPPRGLPLFDSSLPPVTVLVPVFNALAETQRCLASVLAHTAGNYRILVIDDASTDPELPSALEKLAAAHPQVQVLRNETNAGFVATVNRGFREAPGDVLILNSDTLVTSGWLARLCWTAHARGNVATVTPLSNAAGPFSVEMAAGASLQDAVAASARAVAAAARKELLEVPTGHGFCMYVRRDALLDIGAFDAERFPRGYGEENDFCMRALKRGWLNLVDQRSFVYHQVAASFGEDKQQLLARNRQVLDQLHPDYKARVTEAFGAIAFRAIGERVSATLAPAPARRRLLFVIHAGGGGTVNTNADLMHALKEHDCWMLQSDRFQLTLFRLDRDTGSLHELASYVLDRPWSVAEQRRPDYAEIYQRVLIEHAIELVHIRHLIAHTNDLIDAVRALQLPMLFSFHDFYMLCPSIQLIDSRNRYCGGVCRAQRGQCRYSTSWLGPKIANLSSINADWRERSAEAVAASSHLITTTEAARAVILKGLSAARERPFSVIEHGRDFSDRQLLRSRPRASEPLRVLVPGQLGNCKGIDLMRKIKALDHAGDFEFHFLGKDSERLADIGVSHGAYQRDEFAARVADIAPSVAAVLSIWPETYCHTLSEAWACGLPVIATRIGALEERVNASGGGWLMDIEQPAEFVSLVNKLRRDSEAYDAVAARVDAIRLPSVREMARQYEAIYTSLTVTAR